VIESFVDVTVRGLSLGRRIKLGQVRPSSGHLELASPMPVGTHVALATDDGVTIDATVIWVHEQVAGSDRAPGMIVAPVLAGDAAAWWTARVALPDDDPKPRPPRARSVSARPRAQTLQTPPPEGAITDEVPAIRADLEARVTAAAGLAPPKPAAEPIETPTMVMNAVDQAQLEQLTRDPDGAPVAQGAQGAQGALVALVASSTGEHVVIDDGHQTIIMEAIEPSDLEAVAGDLGGDFGGDPRGADAGDDDPGGDDGPGGDADPGGDAGAASERGDNGTPAARGARKRRRRR